MTPATPSPTEVEAPECLTGNLKWLLAQAYHALASEMHAALEPLGVSSRGYQVLATARTREHTQSELAELVGLDKTTMVVTVDELEEAGLAERRPSPSDRRARVIAVTEAGECKVAEGQEIVDRIQSEVLESLPPGERESLLHALSELVTGRLSESVICSPVPSRPLRRREPR